MAGLLVAKCSVVPLHPFVQSLIYKIVLLDQKIYNASDFYESLLGRQACSIHLHSLNQFTVLGFHLFLFRKHRLWEQTAWAVWPQAASLTSLCSPYKLRILSIRPLGILWSTNRSDKAKMDLTWHLLALSLSELLGAGVTEAAQSFSNFLKGQADPCARWWRVWRWIRHWSRRKMNTQAIRE